MKVLITVSEVVQVKLGMIKLFFDDNLVQLADRENQIPVLVTQNLL